MKIAIYFSLKLCVAGDPEDEARVSEAESRCAVSCVNGGTTGVPKAGGRLDVS